MITIRRSCSWPNTGEKAAEPDGFEGARLANKPFDRLKLCRRRELQFRKVGRTIELISREWPDCFTGSG